MKTFRCNSCGYKTKKESKPERCSYCGRSNVMVEIESAENLLEEL